MSTGLAIDVAAPALAGPVRLTLSVRDSKRPRSFDRQGRSVTRGHGEVEHQRTLPQSGPRQLLTSNAGNDLANGYRRTVRREHSKPACAACLDTRRCWVCSGFGVLLERGGGRRDCKACAGSGTCSKCNEKSHDCACGESPSRYTTGIERRLEMALRRRRADRQPFAPQSTSVIGNLRVGREGVVRAGGRFAELGEGLSFGEQPLSWHGGDGWSGGRRDRGAGPLQ